MKRTQRVYYTAPKEQQYTIKWIAKSEQRIGWNDAIDKGEFLTATSKQLAEFTAQSANVTNPKYFHWAERRTTEMQKHPPNSVMAY